MAGDRITDCLDKKRRQGFSGCVKMAFEDGKLSLVSEANHLDFPMSKVFSRETVLELAGMASEKGFCGTLVFFFNRGEIEFYSYLRNYKGDSLEAFLNEGNQAARASSRKGGRKK